jgi:hypothetical protein
VDFSRAEDLSEIIFQKLGVSLRNSGLWIDYRKVQGPFYKISELNRNTELFLKRKSCGLGPRVVDHGRVARSIVEWRRCRQEGAGARWCTHWSRASNHSEAQKVTGRGREWRPDHRDHVAGLTRARVAVWQPGGGDEVVADKKLGDGSTQALGEGVGAVRTSGGVLLL